MVFGSSSVQEPTQTLALPGTWAPAAVGGLSQNEEGDEKAICP